VLCTGRSSHTAGCGPTTTAPRPSLIAGPGGLLVKVTNGTTEYNASRYRISREYGFTDTDGSAPDIWRYVVEVGEPGLDANPDDYR
jgi:hypothetical protein